MLWVDKMPKKTKKLSKYFHYKLNISKYKHDIFFSTQIALSKDIYVIEQSEKKNGYSRKTLQWYLTEWPITNKMSVFAVIPWAA